jgi:hypothetical protein
MNRYNDFFKYCKEGNLNEVKKIYEESHRDGYEKININVDNNYVFRNSCVNGHKEVAQWLYDKSKEDIHTKIDINAENGFAVRWGCRLGNREIVQWLYDLSMTDCNMKININIENDYAFRWSCYNDHIDIAEWLCTLCNDYEIVYYGVKKIEPMVRNIQIVLQKYLDTADEIELSKLYENAPIYYINDHCCMICMSENETKWIQLECKHNICLNCYPFIEKCPLRCYINIRNISFFNKTSNK